MIPHQVVQAAFIPWVKSQGFKPWLGRSGFIRHRRDGFHALLISVSPYAAEWWVEIQLAIRNDLVEETIYQLTGGLKSFAEESITASIPLHDLMGRGHIRFSMPAGDWVALKDQLELAMEQQAWPFFSQYDSLIALEATFNAQVGRPCPIQRHPVYRAYRGLVLGKVTMIRNWDRLVADYRDQFALQQPPAQQIKNFELLQQWLTTTTFN